MLNDRDLAFYRREGYLLVPEVFVAAEIAERRRVTDRLVSDARRIAVSDAVYDLAPGDGSGRSLVRRIKDPKSRDPIFARAARNDRLFDIVAALVGPAVRFDHGKLNFKPPGGQASVGWHQERACYPHTNDDMLAVGIMLADCAPENGPLMVLSGSHQGPAYDHHQDGVFVGALDPDDPGAKAGRAVALTGKAGDCTFHHVRTAHGSTDNRGNSVRPLLLFSYAAVDAWPLVGPVDLAAFDRRILRGQPTLAPRQQAVPVRIPLPRVAGADSFYEDQAAVRGKSFGRDAVAARLLAGA